jgi:hypothetical protein
MTQQLSNCCKAQVSVSSGDEGTSCFMCNKCKRPCDIANLEMLERGGILVSNGGYKIMKEQVSVDEHKNCLCLNCVLGYALTGIKWIAVKEQDYERLKRLDENVKSEISKLKKITDRYSAQNTKAILAQQEIDYLKSLYNENTQESFYK